MDGGRIKGGGGNDNGHGDLHYDKSKPFKHVKKGQTSSQCIIHCTDEKATDLVSPKDLASWRTLVRAAEIRNHTRILEIAKSTPEDEIPEISYHRNCRSLFTMKRDLEKIAKLGECSRTEKDIQKTLNRRSSSVSTSTSRVYKPMCIFCQKEKYTRGSHSREELTQCVELRSDDAVRKAAIEKEDTRILAIVSRDIVAAEGHYHRSCYRSYTKRTPKEGPVGTDDEDADSGNKYFTTEQECYQELFRYIREYIFEKPKVVRLTTVTSKLVELMQSSGIHEIKESTRTHIRRKLNSEFGESLHILPDDKGKLLIFPDNLTLVELVKENMKLKEELEVMRDENSEVDFLVKKTALHLRSTIKEKHFTIIWPPLPSELGDGSSYVPQSLQLFLQCLLSGKTEKRALSQRVDRLIKSVGQDLVYGVSGGRMKPAKHILLAYAVKSLTGCVEVIRILNRFGHGISYTQLEEIDTALCLHKMASQSEECIALPARIHPYVPTALGWDNIDRLEATLSGAGTSHRVNGIVVQPNMYGPHLPRKTTIVQKETQRTIHTEETILPVYNAGTRVGPPRMQYIAVDEDQMLQDSFKKNLVWLLARLHCAANQRISSWTGFNISIRDKTQVSADIVDYLPTINAPATEMSTVQEVLVQSKQIMNALQLPNIVVTFDQALYAKATEILWKHKEKFRNIIPRLGVFHTICTMLSIIGKRFQDAGLADLCIESGVIAEGSVTGVLEGRKYNRAIRFHKLLYEALMRIVLKEYPSWVDSHHSSKKHVIDLEQQIEELCNNLSQDSFSEFFNEPQYTNAAELFREYLDYLRNDNGNLSTFWMSYIDMVDIVLNFLRSTREGNWRLHLAAVRAMIPWCFSYDNLNYARYLSAYLAEMTHLPEDHPNVHAYFESGGFSVQLGSSNTFGKIPMDQTVEETVNKDTQTPGGTKGFSLKPAAVSRYYLTAEYRSTYLGLLRNMVDLEQHTSVHHDLQRSRISRDETDVKCLIDMLDIWINPFNGQEEDIVSLSTGAVVPADINTDLMDAHQIGEEAYQLFRKERLQKTPVVKQFNDTLKKQKLKTFSNMKKKGKSCKTGGREVILKADRNLFGRMVIAAQSRNLDMQEVLAHPLGPLPWALATADGALRKTNKVALAKQLQKNAAPAESLLEQRQACLIDGMGLVQKLKGNQKTFAELADHALSLVLIEGGKGKRIDVIFDVYKENSIKSAERIKRGSAEGTQFKNIAAGHSVQQWRKFLSSSFNKQSLINFLVNEWRHPRHKEKFKDRELLVTCGESCYRITEEGSEEVEELLCTHEEADTRILFHASHASQHGYHSVIVVSEDTDVFILCIAFCTRLSCQIYQKSGTQSRVKYVDISKISAAIGPDMCKSLISLHCFTGCDSVSAFAGRGKVSALKIIGSNHEYLEALQQLGMNWDITSELVQLLQGLTCLIYNVKARTTDINELRYRLFCARKGEAESWQLPPCADSLQKHCLRANYQAAIWQRALQGCPNTPSPVGHGWTMQDSVLVIDWMEVQPAPLAVLELMSCGCPRVCKLPQCKCLGNGLKCTDLCKLKTCTNQAPSDQEIEECVEYEQDSDESDDSDTYE